MAVFLYVWKGIPLGEWKYNQKVMHFFLRKQDRFHETHDSAVFPLSFMLLVLIVRIEPERQNLSVAVLMPPGSL